MMNRWTKKLIVALALVLALALAGCAQNAAPQGAKAVTVKVVAASQNIDETYTYQTDAEKLIDLVNEHADELKVETQDSEYGPFVTSVAGYAADASNNEFWSILVNGEMGLDGISTQSVSNNDVFTLELSTY
ncbi:MAG: DUF4430 domain-containing protein [Eubacteriales bacterium]|nr:DUF4430 domain-containing protein [Eubacteriales bacterium]